MHLTDTLRSLLRRWYVVLAGTILTIALAYGAFTTIGPKYVAEGRILLLPPARTVGKNGNPYMFLTALNQALDILVSRAGGAEVVKPILDAHPGVGYTVTPDVTTSAPVVLLTATGKDPVSTMAVLRQGMATIPVSLRALQDQEGLDNTLRIRTTTLVVDPSPVANRKNQITITVIAVGGGLVGTVVLTGFIDGWLMQRRLRRRPQKRSIDEPPDNPEPRRLPAANPTSARHSAERSVPAEEEEPDRTPDRVPVL